MSENIIENIMLTIIIAIYLQSGMIIVLALKLMFGEYGLSLETKGIMIDMIDAV